MKRKKILLMSIVSVILLCSVFYLSKSLFIKDDKKEYSELVWKEVSIKKGTSIAYSTSKKEFSIRKNVKESDHIFTGNIVNQKEYEVQWKDSNGEKWGPFPCAVLEVRIIQEYRGKLDANNGIVKIYYPYSLSTTFTDSFILEKGGEYVFLTKSLDKQFVKEKEKEAPNDHFCQEKYADVYISDASYDIMAIENETVFVKNEYFSWDNNIMKKVKKWSSKSSNIKPSISVDSNWFIAFDKADFNNELEKVINNPDVLPNTLN